ncbi:MAG: MBOAT family protein [Candidatus Omnitrophica bacterium]|nr:MBOAT family protein [Candidatus Omnitrophota bacterium]
MLFNSYEFIILFLPIVFTVYYWLGDRNHRRAAIAWLLVSSLFFYAWWNPIYLLLILFSMTVNYGVGFYLGKFHSEQKKQAKLLLILGIAFNLVILGYFKYTEFLLTNLNVWLGLDLTVRHIILPLGISFFTFQKIAYLADAYEGKTKDYNFLNYCLFVTFFPQLIAGPIVHHREIIPQFGQTKAYRFEHSNLAVGLTIFVIGLFKKVMLADNLAVYATPVFDAALQGKGLSTGSAWVGTLCYTFQIYFDFSGYSDMAIGLARMLAIKLPLNFNSPYKSINIIDFWRRWHITLSRFLRDYLYFPLGGNRHGSVRRCLNMAIVMLLGGLWHGANWTFVLWGMLHGIYLTINYVFDLLTKKIAWTQSVVMKQAANLLTFFCIIIAWVLFRAESLSSALVVLKSMFFLNPEGYSPYEIEVEQIMAIVVSYLIVKFLPNTQELMRDYEPAIDFDSTKMEKVTRFNKILTWKPSVGWSLFITILFLASFGNMVKVSEFIYFNF